MSGSKAEKMKFAPIRSVADFVLDTKKYLPPAFNDLKRFNNRVTSNMLYYQTNYFIISGTFFLLFLLFNFRRMLVGASAIGFTAAAVLYTLDKIPQLSPLKAKYPLAVFGIWAVNLLFVYSVFRPIVLFMLAILLPCVVWMLHAAVRSRGIKNKINNKVDQIGGQVYTNTPMGIFLATLGFEARDYDE